MDFSIVYGFANIELRHSGHLNWEHYQSVIDALRSSAFKGAIAKLGIRWGRDPHINAKVALSSRSCSSANDGAAQLSRLFGDSLKVTISIEEPFVVTP